MAECEAGVTLEVRARHPTEASHEADRKKYNKLISDAASDFIKIRRSEIFNGSFEGGNVLLLELVGKTGATDPIAGCIAYPTINTLGHSEVELGTIICLLGGFGFQSIMMKIMTLHSIHSDLPRAVFALCRSDNSRSIKGMSRAYFDRVVGTEVEPEGNLQSSKSRYAFDFNQAHKAARDIQNIVENPIITGRDGRSVRLDLSELPLIRFKLLDYFLSGSSRSL